MQVEQPMTTMPTAYFVILSGRYCSPEIAAEFGQLPPSFIPVGNSRLYERQLELAKACGATPILSLPANYTLSLWDECQLQSAGVRIVRSPPSLSLNEAVHMVLEVIDAKGPIYLLYGDTLVDSDVIEGLDKIAVQATSSNYRWAEALCGENGQLRITSGLNRDATNRLVLCGYFSFSDGAALRDACVGFASFDDTLVAYSEQIQMELSPVREWYDFGHLSLIYRSRRNVMVSRAFNTIRSDGVALIKSSTKSAKIAAEAYWYQHIPGDLRVFTPHFLGYDSDRSNYRLEYLYLPTLAEIFTFGELPVYGWHQILNSCIEFLSMCRSETCGKPKDTKMDALATRIFVNLFQRKTVSRLEEFSASRGWASDQPISVNGITFPSLRAVCDELLANVNPTGPDDIAIWHGDFFFGNILFDFRAGRIKVIDPRGGDSDDENMIYGDRRYDIAKLAHSIVGGYDIILAGRCNFLEKSESCYEFSLNYSSIQAGVAQLFRNAELDGSRIWNRETAAMTALLFLTMLPLHSEDVQRQNLLMCNGLLIAHEVFSFDH